MMSWGGFRFGWLVAHRSKRCERVSGKLWTHLKAWAAAATPMSVPSSSFGRRQRAASFLSSFWVEIFPMKWELQGNLDRSWITSNTSTKSIFLFPSWTKESNMILKRREEHLEESCRVFCASLDCEGGLIFLGRLLRHKLLERKKSMPGFFVALHLFIPSTISSTLSFLWSFAFQASL